jgi:hypothetical protein
LTATGSSTAKWDASSNVGRALASAGSIGGELVVAGDAAAMAATSSKSRAECVTWPITGEALAVATADSGIVAPVAGAVTCTIIPHRGQATI